MLFTNARYITCGIQAEIPGDIQYHLWLQIDYLLKNKQKLDWLQVFKLAPLVGCLQIIHTQEKPTRRREFTLCTEEPSITATIFVIDDGSYTTMLLAEEY